MNCSLRALFEFIHAQDDVGVGDVVVVAFQSLYFFGHVVLQSVADIDVASGNVQLHSHPPWVAVSKKVWLLGI